MASRQKKKAKLAAERVEVETVKTVTTKKTLVAAEGEEQGEVELEKGPEMPLLLGESAKVPTAFVKQGGEDGETPGAVPRGSESETKSDLPIVGNGEGEGETVKEAKAPAPEALVADQTAGAAQESTPSVHETAEYAPVVLEKQPDLPDAATVMPTADDMNRAAVALGDVPHIDRTPPTSEEVVAARFAEVARQVAASAAERRSRAGRPFGGESDWMRMGGGEGLPPVPDSHIEVTSAEDVDPQKPTTAVPSTRPQVPWWVWTLIVLATSGLFAVLFMLKSTSATKESIEVTKTADKKPLQQKKVEASKPELPQKAARAEEKKPEVALPAKPVIAPAKPVVQEVAKAEPSVKDLPPLPTPAPKVHVEEKPKKSEAPAATTAKASKPSQKTQKVVKDIPPAVVPPGTVTSTEAVTEKQKPKSEPPKKATKIKAKQKAAAKATPAKAPKKVAAAEQSAVPPPAKPAAGEEQQNKPQRARREKRDSWADDLPTRSIFEERQDLKNGQSGDNVERDAYEMAKRDFPQMPPVPQGK